MRPHEGAESASHPDYADVRLFLILDFDGVINQLPSQDLGDAPEDAYLPTSSYLSALKTDHGVRYQITYSAEMVAELNAVLADPAVQLVWLTTWQHHVIGEMNKIGLKPARPPAWLHFYLRMSDYGSVWAKGERLDQFVRHLPSRKGVIWVDDLAVRPHIEASPRARGLRVASDYQYGITRTQMRQITEYASKFLRS